MEKNAVPNPANKRGVGEKTPTFVQNEFTPWCLKLNIFLKIWYGLQIVGKFFFKFYKNLKKLCFHGENGNKLGCFVCK